MRGRAVERYDVAIVGTGPAGTATALCLARAGARTLLLGRASLSAAPAGESLPPSVTPLLARLGVLDAFLAMGPRPCYGNRSCWGGDGLSVYDFIREPHGHGWHVERPRFDRVLLTAARSAGAMHASASGRLGLRRADAGWALEWQSGIAAHRASAEVVVDASGRRAAVARQLSIRRQHADRLLASCAVLETAEAPPDDSTTLVEATPCGWWYSAALANGALVAAYVTDADLLASGRLWTPSGFLARLNQSEHTLARARRHRYRLAGGPRVTAAGSSFLEMSAGDGWLAVGDAATAHDPLSSHGVGSALLGGLRAAAAVERRAAGSRNAFADYAEQVRRDYAAYRHMRQAYYDQEVRWPDAAFWRRRRAGF